MTDADRNKHRYNQKMKKVFYVITGFVLLGSFFMFYRVKVQPKQLSSSSAIRPTQENVQVLAASTNLIIMKSDSFEPNTLTVKKGTRLVFKNEDTKDHWPAAGTHPTHAEYPEFDSKHSIKPGEEWSFIVEKVGKWHLHDHMHPSIGGEITVEL